MRSSDSDRQNGFPGIWVDERHHYRSSETLGSRYEREIRRQESVREKEKKRKEKKRKYVYTYMCVCVLGEIKPGKRKEDGRRYYVGIDQQNDLSFWQNQTELYMCSHQVVAR